MKIEFLQNLSFKISAKNGNVFVNSAEEIDDEKTVVAIFSSEQNLENKKVVDFPGEFEIAEIAVKSKFLRDENLSSIFKIENVNFGFLGDLRKIVSIEKLEFFANCEVLFLPVFADGIGKKDLKKIVEEIDPKIVIFAGEPAEFESVAAEFGGAEKLENLEISKTKLPADKTLFYILEN